MRFRSEFANPCAWQGCKNEMRYTRTMPQWTVSLPDRLDIFLVSTGAFGSRVKAQEAVEQGRIKINETVSTKSSQRLQEGDVVWMSDDDLPPELSQIEPVNLRLPVLHEDGACFVIEKPAGIAVHPGSGMAPGEKTILHGVAHLFVERGLHFTPDSVLVHRLDRETTGCLLIAKTPEAHRALQEQFEHRSVRKIYLALVAGVPANATATIDAPIGRSVAHRMKMSILGASRTRQAQTTYRTLATAQDTALLACDLHTGRTHQIRVHLSAIGHPILGDDAYSSAVSQRVQQQTGIASLCLHAWRLTFTSPDGEREHTVIAPVPGEFMGAVRAVGMQWKP